MTQYDAVLWASQYQSQHDTAKDTYMLDPFSGKFYERTFLLAPLAKKDVSYS
jgi:hypothetical protein